MVRTPIGCFASSCAGCSCWNDSSSGSPRDGWAGQSERGFLELIGRLAKQVVSWPEARDEPRLFVERSLGRQNAHRDGHAVARVRQSGIVALAAVLPRPELLRSSPALKVTCERVVQAPRMTLADVDDLRRAIALELA